MTPSDSKALDILRALPCTCTPEHPCDRCFAVTEVDAYHNYWDVERPALRAEVETLRAWQRTVAAAEGWCEALGEDIPGADWLAKVIDQRRTDAAARMVEIRRLTRELDDAKNAHANVAQLQTKIERLTKLRELLEHPRTALLACDCTLPNGFEHQWVVELVSPRLMLAEESLDAVIDAARAALDEAPE